MSIAQDQAERAARVAARCRAPWRKAFAAALFAALAVLLPASDDARAGERLTVVELFTSQGCSSCPPAEAYLGSLTEKPGVLTLSFHVDYWDYIGWPDPFADPAFSKRQKRYLKKLNLPYVYTPQIVVDGVLQASGNRPEEVEAAIEAAAARDRDRVDVQLDRLSDEEVRLRIPAGEPVYRDEADILLVRFDEKRVTKVTAGENEGRELENHHVVRTLRPVATWSGGAVDDVLRIMELDEPVPDYCAVIVQERKQGRILGAAMVDMRGDRS